jgi:16S rRNA (guanine966-N2)-methyltransferase
VSRAPASRTAASGAVRIAAGRWKGRRLEVPRGARPTGGRAREALFDILQRRVPGARVLDLFAGSGAVGLEAASRGAARAVLVERDAGALARNVARLAEDAGRVEVLGLDAGAAIRELERRGERFEIVFADPPYGGDVPAAELVAGVARLLARGGCFVLQRDAGQEAPETSAMLRPPVRKAYGRNVFWFFEEAGETRPLL